MEDRAKYLWDLFVVAVTVWVGIEIPLRIAWDYPISGWLLVLYWAVTVVYCIDVWITWRTMFSTTSGLENALANNTRQGFALSATYRKHWLVIDVVSAIPFEPILLLLGAGPGLIQMARLLRMARLSKVTLWVRNVRKWAVLHVVNPSLLQLCFFSFCAGFLAHWIAAGWIVLGGPSEELVDRPDIYLQALYWAVTTLTTVGYGDLTPATNGQTIYTMLVMFLGVGMYGYIIGAVTGLLSNADLAAAQYKQKMDKVNAFMRYRQLPEDLQRRIRDYYTYIWESRLGLDERILASDLPTPLLGEVALFLVRNIVRKVEVFRGASQEFLVSIAPKLRPKVFAPGDLVVRRGEMGHEMYFISRGMVEVLSADDQQVLAVLKDGDYFGEVSLLKTEPRNASVRAATYCDLYCLDKHSFEETLNSFPEFAEDVRKMASERESD